jgi:hypothetical protein
MLILSAVCYSEQLKLDKASIVFLNSQHVCSQKFSTISAPLEIYQEWSVSTILPNLLDITRSVVNTAYRGFQAHGTNPDTALYQKQYESCLRIARLQKEADIEMYTYERNKYATFAVGVGSAMVAALKYNKLGRTDSVRRAIIELLTKILTTNFGVVQADLTTIMDLIISPLSSESSAKPKQSAQQAAERSPSPEPQGVDLLPPAAASRPSLRQRSRSPSRSLTQPPQ